MWVLFQGQGGKCKISGLPIELGRYRPKSRAQGKWPRLATASLDRVDSSRGYVLGNVQWVHKDINKMKGTFSQARLIELCQAVAAQHPPHRPEAGL